ncbi:co-chaperone GroES [Blastopirellula retiformator]|uniref:Co-chaperonin GroES n=1 Tax=Blastopirellula retiformator TaxID=2527970 RepID=A0A5C5UWS3_9BACT|nr:co-chaperone GroES [Blastopirellula retiformator]TWT30020.1 10 kDa chaperonin [Blastopirellula retiformator]
MATATKKKTASKPRLQPLGDRVVVKRDESEEMTAGGIVLPGAAQDKPSRGIVVSVGNGRLLDDGTRAPLQVAEGDRVIFSRYAGNDTFQIGDDEVILIREDDIQAVLTD